MADGKNWPPKGTGLQTCLGPQSCKGFNSFFAANCPGLAWPGAVSSMTCRESVHSIISAADLMFISKQQLYNPKIDTERVSVVPSQSDSGANRGRRDCWIREQPPESPAFQPQLRNFPAGAHSKPR